MNRTQLPDLPPRTERKSFVDLAPQALTTEASLALKDFKLALFNEFAGAEGESLPPHLVARALNEAEALAALTGEPRLFLPTLAAERLQILRRWWRRQQALLDNESLSFAA
jgi:hypothetical protein